MKPSNYNVDSFLQEIYDGIAGLNVEEEFGASLLEDIKLAMECFKEKNTLSVINCLTVLVDKLQTHMILSCCRNSEVEKLLLCLHHLQQILIKLPVCITGPAGATGATGPIGPMGPTGPVGSSTIVTSSSPVSCFPIPKKNPARPSIFDFSTHVVNYGNPHRKR